MDRPEKRKQVTGLEAALQALERQEKKRRELLSSLGTLRPTFEPLALGIERPAFRRHLSEDLVRVTGATQRQDFLRVLQAVDASRIAPRTSLLDHFDQAARRGVEMWLRVAEAAEKPLRQIDRWIEAHDEQIRTVLDGLARYAEAQRQLDVNTVAFTERHGWPLPVWILPASSLHELVAMVDAPKREVSRAVIDLFRPRTRLRREGDGLLLDAPHFASRRPLLKQAFRAMRRGEWYLVINALLPMVEGVLVDVAWPPESRPAKTNWLSAYDSAVDDVESFRREAVVSTLESLLVGVGAGSALFSSFDARVYGQRGEPRSLNRHAILHGAARRYGTAENALKLYLLLIVMAESLPAPSYSSATQIGA